jgi:hypothetical protein
MEARMQPEQDADVLAQEVVNAWGVNVQAGNTELLSADFKGLFEKTCSYRDAKQLADNRREFNILTDEQAVKEQVTRREFLEAYRSFYEAHR